MERRRPLEIALAWKALLDGHADRRSFFSLFHQQNQNQEEYGSHANSDDEYEEYSEEEMLSEEELNQVGSSDEESNQKIPGAEEPDDKGSFTEESNEEDSDEEPEEPLEEEIEEDASVEEIIEEEIREESEEEHKGKEPLRSTVDQVCRVNGSDQVPSLLEVKKASDAVADDEDFCTEDSDEELDEALEEDIEEDASVDEIIEEEISEELDEKPNENEALRSSVDQLPLVNDGDDKSSLLDAKKAADAVADVPRVSTKRRRSGWDIKAEDVLLLNDRDDQCKNRKTRWSSGTKTETSMLVNDNTELNKTRKTRWSSDQRNSNLELFHQKLDKFLKVNTSFPPTINGDHLSKLLEQVDDSISKVVREYEKNKKPKLPPDHNFLFKKKLYLPSKEYPGYNFIGLILGPKGNTLKKMEEDTGATILLRGKSLSRKEEGSYLDEDHVLIGADNQIYFDDAVRMVEKLLIPVDDRHNYHKVAQLRELAKIRGTLMEGKTHLTKKDPLQSGSLPFQSSASLGKNADILGEKKLGITVTGTPSSSLNLNSTNYPGFTAITRKIPETNSWPPLSVSVFPDSGTSFPKSGYDSLKYPETMPSQYSAYLSSTGKASISSYQLPSVRAASDELSSFPAYLKSIDTSHPLDQPASSSSLSSQSSYFTKNFSGNQMNPTW
ncbi:KH domain-containing protein SPIN1 [Platanthera guangdongensis]|uniref:KH domain-containing protein SPIN1 n=1 Tax=Platanthera guangdongensis TaxID=2320717 RepID=A0ABR2M984_9ASPA